MKPFLLFALIPFTSLDSIAQVKLGNNASTINAGSLLEMETTNKGLLLPRVSLSDTAAWTLAGTAVSGMMVYNTATVSGKLQPGPYIWLSSRWRQINVQVGTAAQSWQTHGNTAAATDFIGNNNNLPLIFKVGGQRVGFSGRPGLLQTYFGLRSGDGDPKTTSNSNVGYGAYTLENITTGSANTAIGTAALGYDTSGGENTAVGNSVLAINNDGNGNTGVGHAAMGDLVTGDFNTAMGQQAAAFLRNAHSNVALGKDALLLDTTGSYNTAVGTGALYYLRNAGYNVAVGYASGEEIRTGANNTFVGSYANASTTNLSNASAFGYAAITNASNKIVLGNSSVSVIGGHANWSNLSDARFKRDVREAVPGLPFIMKLRPVTYRLDVRGINRLLSVEERESDAESIAAREAEVQTGFIAQEVERAANETGFNFSGVTKPQNEHDHYSLRYAEFVVPLVKAVQEQQETIKKQEAEIKSLRQTLASHAQTLASLQEKVSELTASGNTEHATKTAKR